MNRGAETKAGFQFSDSTQHLFILIIDKLGFSNLSRLVATILKTWPT